MDNCWCILCFNLNVKYVSQVKYAIRTLINRRTLHIINTPLICNLTFSTDWRQGQRRHWLTRSAQLHSHRGNLLEISNYLNWFWSLRFLAVQKEESKAARPRKDFLWHKIKYSDNVVSSSATTSLSSPSQCPVAQQWIFSEILSTSCCSFGTPDGDCSLPGVQPRIFHFSAIVDSHVMLRPGSDLWRVTRVRRDIVTSVTRASGDIIRSK